MLELFAVVKGLLIADFRCFGVHLEEVLKIMSVLTEQVNSFFAFVLAPEYLCVLSKERNEVSTGLFLYPNKDLWIIGLANLLPKGAN